MKMHNNVTTVLEKSGKISGRLRTPETKFILGEKKELKINSIGIGKKVIAVGVDGCKSFNKIPHITVAVDRANGGKPYMSNEITKWYPVQRDEVVLTGTIKEM